MVDLRYVPFDPERVPYRYRITIGGHRYVFRWTYNFVAGLFFLEIVDPDSGELLWKRPLVYGTNVLHGCALPGLSDYAMVPMDKDGALAAEGITYRNVRDIRVYLFRVR